MVNNDSITIMQKIEELKQWQKQHESKVTSPNALASPTTDKQQGNLFLPNWITHFILFIDIFTPQLELTLNLKEEHT